MQVKAHCLREISKPVTVPPGVLGYRDFVAEPDWKRNLISTTSVLFHPQRRRIACGLTAFDTDLMYEFDPDARTWHSLDYPSVSHKFEIKIHRSLCLGKDGSVYGATAGLHREDQRLEAPGGRIFRYDCQSQRYDMLGTPVPPDYIQTITLDEDRGLIYGVSYPVFRFAGRWRRARVDSPVEYLVATTAATLLGTIVVRLSFPAGAGEAARAAAFLARLSVSIGQLSEDVVPKDTPRGPTLLPLRIVGLSVAAIGSLMLSIVVCASDPFTRWLNLAVAIGLMTAGAASAWYGGARRDNGRDA